MMLIAAVLSVLSVIPEIPLDGFLEEMVAARDQIEVLQADYVQVNRTDDDEFETTGVLLYAKPRRIVFRNDEAVLLVDNLRIYDYEEELQQLQIWDQEDDPRAEALFLGFDSDLGRLKEAYELELFDAGDEEDAFVGLLLTPKPAGQDEDPFFKRVRLYLRAGDYLPVKIQVINEDLTQVITVLKNIVINEPVAAELTQIVLPGGVKIVENDVPVATSPPDGMTLPEAIVPDLGPPQEREEQVEPQPAEAG